MRTAATLLVLLLQRSPVVRFFAEADLRISQGIPQLLRSAVTVASALGGIHSIAGATEFSTQPAAPVKGRIGVEFALVFTVTGTPEPPQSWEVTGPLPPGLSLAGATLRDGIYRFNDRSGRLTGIPTEAGSYEILAVGYDRINQGGDGGLGWRFTVEIEAVQPSFLTQPESQDLTFGDKLEISVTLEDPDQTAYQWRKDGSPIPGENLPVLVIDSVVFENAGRYDVVASNSAGDVTSQVATITVSGVAPAIVIEPVDQVVNPGSGASFVARGEGSPDPEIQWYKDGVALSGATGSLLNLEKVTASDGGDYHAVLRNDLGTETTVSAQLSLDPIGFSRLANLSTRTLVGSGATLIPGFVVQGDASASVLARAVGPTLESLGVTGTMPDPQVRLVSEGNDLAANDDWSNFADQSLLENTRVAVGAFPLDPVSSDAALVVTVDSGPYTLPTTGVDGSSGVVLVELYDSGPIGRERSRLVNLSANSFVGTGSDILIPGFVIQGVVARTVLVRAVGPTLGEFGVAGALENPELRLFAGSHELASNDDWSTGGQKAAIEAAAGRVGAFALGDGSLDAALLITLNPGAYTVQVAGVGETTGVGLVEVYEVPVQ